MSLYGYLLIAGCLYAGIGSNIFFVQAAPWVTDKEEWDNDPTPTAVKYLACLMLFLIFFFAWPIPFTIRQRYKHRGGS